MEHEVDSGQFTTINFFGLVFFSGQDLMMHPELQIDAHTLDPLLKPHILKDLKDKYVFKRPVYLYLYCTTVLSLFP